MPFGDRGPYDCEDRGTARVLARVTLFGERDLDVHGRVEGDTMSGAWSSIACGTSGYDVTGTWQARRAKQK